mmetsp:Transcript_3502/g.10078  ORF Transcript_3502/g.10078 Transcript_3502/m.10078 type:complete len:415 (-) Transcript_3502:183-1427(-)|eukprot:CAMPEP_0118869528 /NCGR_PEP_ID=MMETSP1163-20130328/12838_1 /TAXON_ID=124430 /ORGANISM="Phaeomonas parva, Strain CCMP2877" /LENGTH=414 /DNA_ID=CAMNT_0006804431 /DNA_START=43 /DNA_END=1287 /DNA_ORIENTATION=-
MSAPGADDDWWLYLIMPFISGFIGYATNVVALKMTFEPVEFVGIPLVRFEDQPFGLFGWQGIIPAKAAKMAAKSVDLMTEKLIDVKEVFSRLDPATFTSVIEPGMLQMMNEIINETSRELMPTVWEFLPVSVREEVVLRAMEESPAFLSDFMEDVKENIYKVFDIKHMVVENMRKRKELLNYVFQEVGAKEFVFIERSGFYFGFIFGLIQAAVWYFYQGVWVLPVGGFIVGYATNAIALKVIFEPIDPVRICGVTFHGLFLRRQQEVSAQFAKINSDEILTPEAMWTSILAGPKKEAFTAMLTKHTEKFVDNLAGGLKPLVLMYTGAEEFHRLKQRIALRTMAQLPEHIHLTYDYTKEALDMERTLREAMQALSYQDFEGVLHPVFQEDELKLILVGAALGAAVGVFQLMVLFA